MFSVKIENVFWQPQSKIVFRFLSGYIYDDDTRYLIWKYLADDQLILTIYCLITPTLTELTFLIMAHLLRFQS